MTLEQQPGSPRDRRRAAMLRTIQLAALRLAAEHGPDALTVQAISDAADIAPRTFFTYFASKWEALAVDDWWNAARLRSTLAARPAGEPVLRSLRAVAKQMAAEITGDRERMELWRAMAARYPQQVLRLLGSDDERIGAIGEAIAERLGLDAQRDAYPALAAGAAWLAGQLATNRWLQASAAAPDGELPPADAFVDELFDLLEQGL
jgi:AcrR family transcriptional regulator